jgi:hypothetical protein
VANAGRGLAGGITTVKLAVEGCITKVMKAHLHPGGAVFVRTGPPKLCVFLVGRDIRRSAVFTVSKFAVRRGRGLGGGTPGAVSTVCPACGSGFRRWGVSENFGRRWKPTADVPQDIAMAWPATLSAHVLREICTPPGRISVSGGCGGGFKDERFSMCGSLRGRVCMQLSWATSDDPARGGALSLFRRGPPTGCHVSRHGALCLARRRIGALCINHIEARLIVGTRSCRFAAVVIPARRWCLGGFVNPPSAAGRGAAGPAAFAGRIDHLFPWRSRSAGSAVWCHLSECNRRNVYHRIVYIWLASRTDLYAPAPNGNDQSLHRPEMFCFKISC